MLDSFHNHTAAWQIPSLTILFACLCRSFATLTHNAIPDTATISFRNWGKKDALVDLVAFLVCGVCVCGLYRTFVASVRLPHMRVECVEKMPLCAYVYCFCFWWWWCCCFAVRSQRCHVFCNGCIFTGMIKNRRTLFSCWNNTMFSFLPLNSASDWILSLRVPRLRFRQPA